MLNIETFKNQLMGSNCYLVWDEVAKRCFIVDPASEKSLNEIDFISKNNLELDYVFLTHEHTDHTWGVNSLIEKYPDAKVVCSSLCKEALPKTAKAYFQLYYDDPSYEYNVKRVDFTTEDAGWHLEWTGHNIVFFDVPGHSPGSVCIAIDGILFGGDTLMPFKPVIKKRTGGSLEVYRKSLILLREKISPNTMVYPGHGECIGMDNVLGYFSDIIS